MDETQSSRVSDAAASRKRRSSILKSQRAPRTPFSELEFNVATPTDAGKSRRVSFSRRTGVAEFVTNEATTTWKNFYEEHNKSLESSGNETGANAVRPSISHIGKRIFDQQFEEVEAVDFGSALIPGNSRAAEFNISINNVNLTEQLAALEYTVDDKKFVAPQQHFELSSLTDHQSKVFSDDLTIPVMGDMSNQINVNFSIMNPMGNNNDKCDDLDEIQKDLKRSHNVVCPGPFREQNMSEYIEVDLNMTHVAVAESDMSITDTVRSPKVKDVTRSSTVSNSRKTIADKDWTADKENIAVLNPYVAPRESDNFAINEVPDQVLVFDGKRLIVQSDQKEIPVGANEYKRDKKNYRELLLPDTPLENTPQRKTIVLNINDDLPNFIDEPILPCPDFGSVSAQEFKNTVIFDGNLSMTQALPNIVQPSNAVELSSKRKTVVNENMTGNISLTQAVSSNVILHNNNTSKKRKTIIYDDSHGNISMTQAISTNVLLDNQSGFVNNRRTTVYDGENVSFTEMVPPNLMVAENGEKSCNKTILFQNNMEELSFTKVLPNNIQLDKSQINKTTVFERSVCNISMTQVLPTNIMVFSNEPVTNKRKTIVYENDDANVSMTQAIPTTLIIEEKTNNDEYANKIKTAVSEDENIDVSLTQVIPANIIQQEISYKSEFDIRSCKLDDKFSSEDLKNSVTIPSNSADASIHKSKSVSNKTLTIMYDENVDVSMTQALPSTIFTTNHLINPDQPRKSPVFDKADCNFSQVLLPSHILLQGENNEKCQNDDIAMTQIVSNISSFAQKGVIVDNDKCKNNVKSVDEIKHNISFNTKHLIDLNNTGNSEISNLSRTKPIPNKIFEIENEILKSDMEKFTNSTQFGEKTLLQDTIHDKSHLDVIVYQAKIHDISEVQINKTDHGDLQEEESKTSIGIEKVDNTIEQPIRSISEICSNSEVGKEKDFEMQINLQKEEDLLAGNLEVIETATCKIAQDIKGQRSILHELLDMSSSSVVYETSDKNVIVNIDAETLAEKPIKISETYSNDAIFLITRDSDEKIQSDDKHMDKDLSTVKILNVGKLDEIENKLLPALECNIERDNNLEGNLIELSHTVIDEKKKSPPQNRYYEKIVSSDLQASFKQKAKHISDVKDMKIRKSFKEADDTKELLEILSDFTDRKSIPPIPDEDKVVSQIKLRTSMALEHKTEIPEPKRLSFAPKRQSIVLTREELLNNLSMAQATLQKSRFESEDSEIDYTVTESPTEINDTATESPTEANESISSPKKSVRMSNEVVKTLHFEDESYSEASLKSDVKISPLKKTAFGETSYMKDCKANVIPTYLKDVSDNIKALMNDLVKPRPDQMPFEVTAVPKTKKETSTCSTQIQANLITSSQIDLDVELHSNVNSVYELDKAESLVTDIADAEHKAYVGGLKRPISGVIDISEINAGNELYAVKHGKSPLRKQSQKPVLIFDHRNPLNNVLLAPPNCVDVHKYNPVKSSEALCVEDNSNNTTNVDETKKGDQYDVERVITQYNVESNVGLPSGDACLEKKADSHSLFSNPSKPLSMDRSTEGFAMEVKNTEVNTVIVMKGNKELLEASSSLTLVDDALTQNVFDIKVETGLNEQNSPVKVIYKIDAEDVSMLENVDSDQVSNDELMEYPKAKKRSYSPSRRDVVRPSTLSNPDVTPKPVNKLQKMSNSPIVHNDAIESRRIALEKPYKNDSNSDKTECHKKRSSRKSKSSPKHKKPGTDVTVQQLITEYKISKMEQDMIEDQIIEAIHDRMSLSGSALDVNKIRDRSPDGLSSCTSSKNQNEMQEPGVKETVSYVGSQPSKVDWQPDLKELSSNNTLMECDSGVNVVAKIDMLPFMGSRECEWETSGGDTWVFRLLRARLRLRVRLAHRHHNALRTRVRADTPVTEICVDSVPVEDKDPLAELCVRFAAEAMRYECGRGCARAGDVPLVLRRCGGVARVALRWARAMRDARTRLAYTLTGDGVLALKVANIPLRSVWEVSMRLELVVEDAREAAWPRAGDVRVAGVLADCAISAEETARALQPLSHDWGHAPRTIWKIFRYLKNKTREDDFLRAFVKGPPSSKDLLV